MKKALLITIKFVLPGIIFAVYYVLTFIDESGINYPDHIRPMLMRSLFFPIILLLWLTVPSIVGYYRDRRGG